MTENSGNDVRSLSKKAAANRRNAKLSTGPKTEAGKNYSRLNALKHGLLASVLLVTEGEGGEHESEFEELLHALYQDLAPVGRLEEMMVEKIAVCSWRLKRALRYEGMMIRKESEKAFQREDLSHIPTEELRARLKAEFENWGYRVEKVQDGSSAEIPSSESSNHTLLTNISDSICNVGLPAGEALNSILRYETSIQRQMVHAISQLERLQRTRKGEHVPAPVSVQISNDQ